MTQKPTGGPAFPTGLTPGHYSQEGMALRDWFAGQAMAAMISTGKGPSPKSANNDETIAEFWARQSFLMADAMLAAREASE
jgi:hypothetical protein